MMTINVKVLEDLQYDQGVLSAPEGFDDQFGQSLTYEIAEGALLNEKVTIPEDKKYMLK